MEAVEVFVWAALSSGVGAVWCSRLASCLCSAGASPGGVVFGPQSQWRLRGVSIPRQVPAPLGKDEGATCFGRGEGDGESCLFPAKNDFQTRFLPSRKIPHFSLWKGPAPCLADLLLAHHSLVLRC